MPVLALPAGASAARARVKVAECRVFDSVSGSFAVFEGRMRAGRAAAQMSMRFTLQQKFGTPGFETVRVPELAVWRTAQPGVRRFTYKQRVRGLEKGGEYRMRVRFRWQDASGRVVRRARRHSRPCGRTGPLPNLRIVAIGARPGAAAGTWDYNVDVTNDGDLAAGKFPVSFSVDGATLDQREVSALAPGQTATVRFSGPACGRRVRAQVDPAGTVHESNEDDNRLSLRCPALGAPVAFG